MVALWPRITSRKLDVVAHRRRDQDLAAFVVVGDDRGHVGHVAAVVLEVQSAGADDPAREADAHRQDQVRELVDEQVGVHATAEVPVAAPLGISGAVERLVGRQAELGPQEHLPVDGLGGHLLEERIVPPLALAAVAIIAGLALQDVADLPLGDHLVGHAPARIGGRLHAHGEDLLGLLGRLGDAAGLVDRVGHRLFAVDVLAGLHGVDRHLGVPVVGRGDQDDVDVLVVEDLAIVLGDAVLVFAFPVQPAFLGGVVEPAAGLPVRAPSTCRRPRRRKGR